MSKGLARIDTLGAQGEVLVLLDGEKTAILSALSYVVRGIEPAIYELPIRELDDDERRKLNPPA